MSWYKGFFFGNDESFLTRPLPPELQNKHVNQILNRHDFHPYRPNLDKSHECSKQNDKFYQCMVSLPEELELYQKHVQCYYPLKVELMKCFVRHPPPKNEEGMLDHEK